MGILIVASDFTGKFAIPQNAFSDLDGFITDTEESYLIDLLGADFYVAFKANLVNKVPVLPKYKTLYDPLAFDYGNKSYDSKGMKKMLLGFIFFDYMRQIKYKPTEMGMVSNVMDTSKTEAVGSLYKYLNDATEIHNIIQVYVLLKNPADYTVQGEPVFNGSIKAYACPMLM